MRFRGNEYRKELDMRWAAFFDAMHITYRYSDKGDQSWFYLTGMNIRAVVIGEEEMYFAEAEHKRITADMENHRTYPSQIFSTLIITGAPGNKDVVHTYAVVHHDMPDGSKDTRLTGIDTPAKSGTFMCLGGEPFFVVEGFTNKDHFDGKLITVADSFKLIRSEDKESYAKAVEIARTAVADPDENIGEVAKPVEEPSAKEEPVASKEKESDCDKGTSSQKTWLHILAVVVLFIFAGYLIFMDVSSGELDIEFLKKAFFFSVIFSFVHKEVSAL